MYSEGDCAGAGAKLWGAVVGGRILFESPLILKSWLEAPTADEEAKGGLALDDLSFGVYDTRLASERIGVIAAWSFTAGTVGMTIDKTCGVVESGGRCGSDPETDVVSCSFESSSFALEISPSFVGHCTPWRPNKCLVLQICEFAESGVSIGSYGMFPCSGLCLVQ